MRVQSFRFEVKLVRLFVGKLDDLVFDRWTIARPDRLNLSAVHRRAMHVLADNALSFARSPRDVARHLRIMMRHAFGAEAEGRGVGVSRLHREARPVNAASIQPRRRSCLQPAAAQAQFLQRFPQQNRSRFSGAPRGILLLAAVNQAIEKSPSSDDHSLRADGAAVAQANAENPGLRVLSSQFSVLSKINIASGLGT